MKGTDLVVGKKYNYLHEPGTKITFERKSDSGMFLFHDGTSPIGMNENELTESISEIKGEKAPKKEASTTPVNKKERSLIDIIYCRK